MTGVYHGHLLARLAKTKNQVFTMGSHFLLIEWPELVAESILRLLFES